MPGINPYSPYGYAPQFGPQSFMSSLQSPYITQPPAPPTSSIQPTQSNLEWIPVPNVKQVEQVSVQPGAKAWVMVQNEPIFALRSADNMGLITTDYYRFEKIDPSVMATTTTSPDYVTRAEFQQFVESLRTESQLTTKEAIDK